MVNTPKRPHIMLIAGESSGDLLGVGLMAELKKKYPYATFVGVGGEKMQSLGLRSVFDMEELNVMGIFEVLPKIPKLLGRRSELVQVMETEQVDLLITIDAPDFCLRVAQKAKKKLKMTCIHYVSPSVWAWRRGRTFKMAKYLDHILLLFPFEVDIYNKADLPCTFVGHPVAERLSYLSPKKLTFPEGDACLALLPGSRKGVISRMFPTMLKAFREIQKEMPNLKAVMPLVHEHHKQWMKDVGGNLDDIEFVAEDKRFDALAKCQAALATSGTSNLELAMIGLPTVVGYKMSENTYRIASRLVNVPYISPVNWVLGERALPEFIQEDATVENFKKALIPLLKDTKDREYLALRLLHTRQKLLLKNKSPSLKACEAVCKFL
jgi:lipid-A-disaccharide synthase